MARENSAPADTRVSCLLMQILAEATALKHVDTKTTRPYAVAIAEKAEQALAALENHEHQDNLRD